MQMPVYVTRPTADGDIAHWSANAYFVLVVFVLVMLNAFFWGVIGVVEAVAHILGWFA